MARPRRAPGVQTGAPLLLLDPKVREKIMVAVRVGNFRSVAARHAGISYHTLLSWEKRGREAQELRSKGQKVPPGEQPFLEFLDDLEQADADGEASIVADIRRQMPRNPAEARSFLSLRYRERWGPSAQKIELTGADGGPIEIVQGFSDHERAALRKAIDQALAEESRDGAVESPA